MHQSEVRQDYGGKRPAHVVQSAAGIGEKAMGWTAFEARVHGFAFTNTWRFEEPEQHHIHDIFTAYFVERRMLGSIGVRLTPLVVQSLRAQLGRHLTPHYGLCGGMCFAALDFFMHSGELAFPRGLHADDQPAPDTGLRRYIWRRQLDSLVSDGAKFLAWVVSLNYVPAFQSFSGGAGWLLARSKREWKKLKTLVDQGKPVPIGLVRAVRNVYEDHQVLAIGYEEMNESHGTIVVYDPNCPDKASTINIEFGDRQLDGQESCGTGPPLRGFFCE